MPLPHPFIAPDLDSTFGARKSVMKALNKAGVKSVVPIMLLPQEILRDRFPGIGVASARFITAALAEQGLPHRTLAEKRFEFINRHFGCIEDAPISVLQIDTILVLGKRVSRQAGFNPLEVVSLMEDLEPQLTVIDLLLMGEDTVRKRIEKEVLFGLSSPRLDRDIKHLKHRLRGEWQLQFSTDTPELQLANE